MKGSGKKVVNLRVEVVVAQLFCVAQSVKSIRFHSRCSIELKSDDKRQWSAKKDSFGHENATEIEKGPKNPINPRAKNTKL